jgi:hypothetical protein
MKVRYLSCSIKIFLTMKHQNSVENVVEDAVGIMDVGGLLMISGESLAMLLWKTFSRD